MHYAPSLDQRDLFSPGQPQYDRLGWALAEAYLLTGNSKYLQGFVNGSVFWHSGADSSVLNTLSNVTIIKQKAASYGPYAITSTYTVSGANGYAGVPSDQLLVKYHYTDRDPGSYAVNDQSVWPGEVLSIQVFLDTGSRICRMRYRANLLRIDHPSSKVPIPPRTDPNSQNAATPIRNTPPAQIKSDINRMLRAGSQTISDRRGFLAAPGTRRKEWWQLSRWP